MVCCGIPSAVLGIVVVAFGIADLRQGDADQVLPLIAGVDIGVGVFVSAGFHWKHGGQKVAQQSKDCQE